MRDWLVAADDRTGAFEVAAQLAGSAAPVMVAAGHPVAGACVVDLGSRALAPAHAAARAAAIEAEPARWVGHKMDSTLRGNWASEVMARHAVSGRRVIVLPGWPALGRTCVGGVVRVHGEPVGSVLEQLPDSVVAPTPAALSQWLLGDGPVVVCDIADTAAVLSMAVAAASAVGALIVGPAGPLGAVFAARSAAAAPSIPPAIEEPVLVICGSANPVSRQQVALLAAHCPSVTIVAAPDAEGPLHVGVADDLAAAATDAVARLMPSTIVIIGGDTAAAYLGAAPRLVGGNVAPGMPWSRDAARRRCRGAAGEAARDLPSRNIWQGYGMTESSSVLTFLGPTSIVQAAPICAPPASRCWVSCCPSRTTTATCCPSASPVRCAPAPATS